MNWTEIAVRWGIPLAVLTAPWWFGFLLTLFRLDSAAFFVAIVPQYLINPYYSHYGPHRCLGGWLPMWVHWAVVLLIYGVVTRRRKPVASLGVFVGISVVSVLVAHAILQLSGYSFELDSL